MTDRMLAVAWRLTVAVLTDPLASFLLAVCFLTTAIVVGVAWHYLVRGCAALEDRAKAAWIRSRRDRVADIPVHVPTDPQAWNQLDTCEQAWRTSPTLRARIIQRVRERAAIRRARTRI